MNNINDFSLVCRVLGSLWYRQPNDESLRALFKIIAKNTLQHDWPLEQTELFESLSKTYQKEQTTLSQAYNCLFVGDKALISLLRSNYLTANDDSYQQFLIKVGYLQASQAYDHLGFILLLASWIEDHLATSQNDLLTLFKHYLLPWANLCLKLVESNQQSAFYSTLSLITQGALSALWEDLSEQK